MPRTPRTSPAMAGKPQGHRPALFESLTKMPRTIATIENGKAKIKSASIQLEIWPCVLVVEGPTGAVTPGDAASGSFRVAVRGGTVSAVVPFRKLPQNVVMRPLPQTGRLRSR